MPSNDDGRQRSASTDETAAITRIYRFAGCKGFQGGEKQERAQNNESTCILKVGSTGRGLDKNSSHFIVGFGMFCTRTFVRFVRTQKLRLDNSECRRL
jgi:hypothetical protein